MIEVKDISSNFLSKLNALSDLEFVLFNDVGEFEHEAREQNSNDIHKYINGIFQPLTPNILPLKNLQIITQGFRITFAIDIDAEEKTQDGQFKQVEELRETLQSYITTYNGVPFTLSDSDSKSFEITPSFDGITIGTATQLSPIGNVLPVYFDFEYIFVESGVNTNNVSFIINGENMFFQEYSATRVRTAETSMYANCKSQKTNIQANGISFNLKLPLLNTTQSKFFENDIYNGGQNEAICVERYRANAKTPYSCYIMIVGNISETGAIGQNIGQTIDLVEGKPENLTYGTGWQTISVENSNTYSFDATNIAKKNIVIFWGDDTYNKIIKTSTSQVYILNHTYSKVGNYTIRYYAY